MNTSAEISLRCPSCGIASNDGFECLAENEVHELTCAQCGNRFQAVILDCLRCADDDVIASQSDIDVSNLVCKACGSNIFGLEHDDETSSL
jgi:hypothetical protein